MAAVRGGPQHDPLPICAKTVFNFRDEANPGDSGKILEAMKKERPCSEFTRHHIGLSPKEHREMVDQLEFRKWQAEQRRMREEFEAKQREGDQSRQERQRADDLARQKRQREDDAERSASQRADDQKRQDRQRHSDRGWAIGMVLLVAVVGLLFGLIQFFIILSIK